jgi:shikimate kinase
MEARRPIYESIADSVIDVNEKSESEIVTLVMEILK